MTNEKNFCVDCGVSLVTQSFYGLAISKSGIEYKDGFVCDDCNKIRKEKHLKQK